MRFRVWEEPDIALRTVARGARKILSERAGYKDLSNEQASLYASRVTGFIADNESRETVNFRFDNDPDQQVFQLKNSIGKTSTDRNGLIEGVFILSREKAGVLLQAQKSTQGWLRYTIVSAGHHGLGRIKLIDASGLSVISDIDDTIKVTEIPLGEREVLRNTFFRKFTASPCMANMYQAFGEQVAFHYVSGAPWQLYEPLNAFLFSDVGGFPHGSMHMKNVRANPFESESFQDIWKLVKYGSHEVTFQQKTTQISTLLRHFPKRKYILIGDSGEQDPEVYRLIRQQFPEQVIEIRIRDVVNDVKNNPGRFDNMQIIAASANGDGYCTEPIQLK